MKKLHYKFVVVMIAMCIAQPLVQSHASRRGPGVRKTTAVFRRVPRAKDATISGNRGPGVRDTAITGQRGPGVR